MHRQGVLQTAVGQHLESAARVLYQTKLLENVDAHGKPRDLSGMRWCLDTPEDMDWFRSLVPILDWKPPHPTTAEVLAALLNNPDLARLDLP